MASYKSTMPETSPVTAMSTSSFAPSQNIPSLLSLPITVLDLRPISFSPNSSATITIAAAELPSPLCRIPNRSEKLVSMLTLMSIIAMTVFFRTNMKHDSLASGGIYMGAMFFGILMIMFNGFSELALTVMRVPVFFKQRDLIFYPAWAYTIASWILKIPISFMEVSGYVFITYYVIGYDPNVGRFFKQYLIMFAINQVAASLFRFIGGAGRNMVVANVFAMLVMMSAITLNSFVIIRVKKWWISGYWISPLMYVQNAITVNEMLGHSWDKLLNRTISNETGCAGP